MSHEIRIITMRFVDSGMALGFYQFQLFFSGGGLTVRAYVVVIKSEGNILTFLK